MKYNVPKRRIFKLNEDDILEILTDYLAGENDLENYQSIAMMKGTPEQDLRFVAVFGDYEDEEMAHLDLDKLDQKMNYNGPVQI